MSKYTPEQIAAVLDYAVLDPNVGINAIVDGAEFCEEHDIKCFCVSSTNVYIASSYHHNVASVIGFPHGNVSRAAKYSEAIQAVEDGAKELDVVLNYGRFNTGDTGVIREDLEHIANFAHHKGVLVKAILETCTMEDGAIALACDECIKSEVDFVKTSTGFGNGGATEKAVDIMLAVTKGTGVKVKASGGIRCYDDVARYLDMGVARLGTSRYLELLP